MPIFDSKIRVDCHKTLIDQLDIIAKGKGITRAELVRNYLIEAVNIDMANSGLDSISKEIRDIIRSELKPFENRIAKITAKTSIAAATSMFMHIQVLDDMKRSDTVEVYQKARKKAVSYVKAPEEE